METDFLLERIKKEAKKQGVSIKKLAELIGFSDTNLYNIINQKQQLTMETFLKISAVLQIDPTSWFKDIDLEKVMESQVKYKTKDDHTDCVKRDDYEFLKEQIRVLNKLLIDLRNNDDDNNRPTLALKQ